MQCHSCSQNLPEGSRYCHSCGVPVHGSILPTGAPIRIPADGNTPVVGLSSDESRFVPGSVLAERYRIIGLLGKGGMGEVYRADDLKLGQPVALKFLPEHVLRDGAALARFHREVRIARQVSHPNVCRVFDIAEVNGQPFLSMEYIDGENVASLLRRIGRLPQDKATEIARQVCAGLAAAHDLGVLHRDLKPANVMIDGKGKARVTDFGLAGLSEELQKENPYAGTPAYMAPEQLAGKEASIRSDIFSLGLLLYEIFTGKRVFSATSMQELLRQRETTPPSKPSSHVKDIDPLVERVILRCLEKNPSGRPSSAIEVAAALPGGDPLAAALAAGETPSPEMVAAAPKEGSLRPASAIACLAGVLALLFGIVLLSDRVSLHLFEPLEKSPQVLADRAATMLAKMGYTAPPVDTIYGFDYDEPHWRWYRAVGNQERWNRFKSHSHQIFYFWYRQSPIYLTTSTQLSPTLLDPPMDYDGMANVILDSRGNLLEFHAEPGQVEKNPIPGLKNPDWQMLFDQADLKFTQFHETQPKWIPRTYADSRKAWEGVDPNDSKVSLRIEAAAFESKPVYFQIIGPWSKPLREQQLEFYAGNKAFFILTTIFWIFTIVGGVVLARRNLKLGRGDRRGALKIALFVLLTFLPEYLFGAHHIPTLSGELSLFLQLFESVMFSAALVWLLYIALEPFVRRRWPGKIISWSRLLAGDFRDPMIGRDILIGALLGSGCILLDSLRVLLAHWLNNPPEAMGIWSPTILGLPQQVSRFSNILQRSAIGGLAFLFGLFLFTLLLKNDRRGMIAHWLILFVIRLTWTNALPVDIVFTALLAFLFELAVGRYGLLASVSCLLFIMVPWNFSLSTHLSAWHAGSTFFVLSMLLALSFYSFSTSLGGRSIFKGSLAKLEGESA